MEAVARHLVRLRGLLTAATYEDLARTLRESALEFERRERSQAEALVRVAQFLENWRIERRGLLRLLRKDRLGQWVLVYQLLDPAILARPVFDTVSASILMSGTLSPAEATREVLGLAPERSVLEEYASPFARENRLVLLDSEVTTAFQDRSDAMFERIAAHLGQTSEAVPGHMAAFFPSYALLENVRRRLDCAREVVVEERGIGKEERERLVGALRSSRRAGSGEPKLLLGVLGGGLSEGYDYEDNLLRAVAIVGLPLAPPSLEQDARIRYATERFGAKGKLYSYVVPSMNRVLQAAGRLIRGPEDHGVILLMDKRFGWNEYRGCMPKDFAPRPTDAPARDVRVFFGAREASAST
jgi:Rad3-related DNA helicase